MTAGLRLAAAERLAVLRRRPDWPACLLAEPPLVRAVAAYAGEVRLRYRGLPLLALIRPGESVRWYAITGRDEAGRECRCGPEPTPRKAALAALQSRWRTLAPGEQVQPGSDGRAFALAGRAFCCAPGEGWRDAAIRYIAARAASRPDPAAPDTLGWRVWRWRDGVLSSPQRGTPWPEDGILEAEKWSDAAALRGEAGIHARRLPRDWRRADWRHDEELAQLATSGIVVAGIIERWGRAVVGTEGWRAERAAIRGVVAPSTEIGLAIEAAYPTIEVVYPDDGLPAPRGSAAGAAA